MDVKNNRSWYVASIYPPSPDYHWARCVEWCRQYLEQGAWFFQGEGVFEFKNERDYLWFILKWQ